ncbi:unnamed protein product, partial [Porites lobata]
IEPAEVTLQPANPAKRIQPLDLLKRFHKRGINCPDGRVVSNTRRDKQMRSKVLFFGSCFVSIFLTNYWILLKQLFLSQLAYYHILIFFFQILYFNPWLNEPDISCYVISLQFKLSNPANRNIGA